MPAKPAGIQARAFLTRGIGLACRQLRSLRELACLLQSQQQESMTGETDEEATCVEKTGAQQEDSQEP
ncbi:MAG: hypothetical protein ACK2U9_09785, partial [Anaerolineae bacterium]